MLFVRRLRALDEPAGRDDQAGAEKEERSITPNVRAVAVQIERDGDRNHSGAESDHGQRHELVVAGSRHGFSGRNYTA